jgi:hypothetical protein
MAKKNKVPVVIVRKDKKLKKTGHLLAFMLTGGMSAPVTAAKAATNAGYNARTRKLQREAEQAEQDYVPSYDPGICRGCGRAITRTPEGSSVPFVHIATGNFACA